MILLLIQLKRNRNIHRTLNRLSANIEAGTQFNRNIAGRGPDAGKIER